MSANEAILRGLLTAIKENDEPHIEQCLEKLLEGGFDINLRLQNGQTLLHCAVQLEQIKTVTLLCEKGANVNAQDRNESTPLHYAAKDGAEDILKELLRFGADVNARNKENATPLHCGAGLDTAEILNTLLERGSDINAANKKHYTALHAAVFHGRAQTVKILLDKGCNITINDSLEKPFDLISKLPDPVAVTVLREFISFSIRNKDDVLLNTLLQLCVKRNFITEVLNDEERSIWGLAINNANIGIFKLLLDNGADIKCILNFPEEAVINVSIECLSYIARNNKIDLLKDLISICRKKNIYSEVFNKVGGKRVSPLLEAIDSRAYEVAKLLLQEGADVNAQYKGHTCLHAAVCVRNYEMVMLILEKNPRLTSKELESVTSLLPPGAVVEPEIKKLLEDYIRNKRREEDENIKKEQKKKEAQRKASPEYQIEQLIKEAINLNNYTYAILPKAKGQYRLRISSGESFLKNLGIYYLFKNDGINVVLDREGVTLSFDWTEEGKERLSQNLALFESALHKNICNTMSSNQDKMLKVFNIEGKLNSNNFIAPIKPEIFEVHYFFRSVSFAKEFCGILMRLNFRYETAGKRVNFSYPENVLLDNEECDKQCKIWAEKLAPKKEAAPTDATLENSKTTATPKLPPAEENAPSPYLAEIFRLNEACRSSNGLGEKRKGQKSNVSRSKRTALELESNPPKPNSELTRHTKTTKILRPVPNGSLLSEPKLLPTQHQDSNNARLPIKIPTISTPAPDARNSVSCSKDGFFNNTAPQIITRSNRDVRINLATGQEIPVKKIMRSESSTSASSKVSSRKKLNPTEIRAIYYRNIHALLNTLFNIEASDPAFLAAKNKEVYNKSMALRNALVHRFCMESNWAHNEEKKNILLELEKARPQELGSSYETINRISRMKSESLESKEYLVRLMNEELTYLKDAFQPFHENKAEFFNKCQEDLRDACKASVSIIIECYNILGGRNADEIENTLKMDSPELKNLLNECRIRVRNQAMHVCERAVKYSNTQEGAEIFVIHPEMFYNLLLRLSKLEEFVLAPSSESSLSFYPRLG